MFWSEPLLGRVQGLGTWCGRMTPGNWRSRYVRKLRILICAFFRSKNSAFVLSCTTPAAGPAHDAHGSPLVARNGRTCRQMHRMHLAVRKAHINMLTALFRYMTSKASPSFVKSAHDTEGQSLALQGGRAWCGTWQRDGGDHEGCEHRDVLIDRPRVQVDQEHDLRHMCITRLSFLPNKAQRFSSPMMSGCQVGEDMSPAAESRPGS